MTEDELKRIIDNLDNNSINAYTTEEYGDALDYYYGRPYGNEQYGRSQVTTREVMEAIEWSLPALIRVFVGGETVCSFNPVGEEDEPAAEQETDVVNHVFMRENNAFLITYDWVKDALLQRNGYIKIYWNEEEKITTEVYTGLLDIQLADFDDDNIEIVEHTSYIEEIEQETPQGIIPVPVELHDIKVKITQKKGGIKIENVPVEEIRVARNCRTIELDYADYVAHDTTMKAGELLEMGIDPSIIAQLGDHDEEYDLEHERSVDDTREHDYNFSSADDSMRDISVTEATLLVDYDGDGRAERRRVLKSGNFILLNEEIDYCPFESITPVRMPHKHQGMSKADQVMPIQLIKSTLIRQMLDNLYLTNNPEKEVLAEYVNIDDLLSSTPGGIKRVDQMGSIREIQVPFTAAASLPMLDVLDTMAQKRTGVSHQTMAMDGDVLSNSTKGAFMGALEKGNEQMELLARLLAETGFKNLFKKIHHLLRKYQDVEKVIKLRGKWVNVDPSEWRERDDLSISVGLGTASKDQLIQRLMALSTKQLEAAQAGMPIVTPENYFKTMQKLAEAVDLGEGYWTHPDQFPKPPPQPDQSQMLAQLQMQLTQMQEETKRIANENKNQIELLKLQQKDELERLKEGRERAKLELEHDQNIPGSIV